MQKNSNLNSSFGIAKTRERKLQITMNEYLKVSTMLHDDERLNLRMKDFFKTFHDINNDNVTADKLRPSHGHHRSNGKGNGTQKKTWATKESVPTGRPSIIPQRAQAKAQAHPVIHVGPPAPRMVNPNHPVSPPRQQPEPAKNDSVTSETFRPTEAQMKMMSHEDLQEHLFGLPIDFFLSDEVKAKDEKTAPPNLD